MPPRRRPLPQPAQPAPQRPAVPLETLTGYLTERIEVRDDQLPRSSSGSSNSEAASGSGGTRSFKFRPAGGQRSEVTPELTLRGKTFSFGAPGSRFAAAAASPASPRQQQRMQQPVKMKPMRTSSSADKKSKCVVM
jgi:hypothetical protein